MLKRILQVSHFSQIFLMALVGLFLGLVCHCAGPGMKAMPLFERDASNKVANFPLLWTKRMKGAISGLSLSKNGKVILVASSPDPDIAGSAKSYLLTQLDSKGQVNWELKMSSPVKDQDISKDGALAVINTYGNEVKAIDPHGKILWTVEGFCRPQVLNTSQLILCYHDDDSESGVAFDVFDWSGRKVLSFPITPVLKDILVLKISSDEKSVAIALTDGEVLLLDSKFKPVWRKNVEGEVTDLSISSATSAGEGPKVAVIYQEKAKKSSQLISVFDGQGHLLKNWMPSFHAIQVEFEPTGNHLFYYGNDSQGQNLSQYSLVSGKEVWRRSEKNPADYSTSILVSPQRVVMGFEEMAVAIKHSHLLAFGQDGLLQWDLRLWKDGEGYLYSHKISGDGSLLVVGTDDGRLDFYQVYSGVE